MKIIHVSACLLALVLLAEPELARDVAAALARTNSERRSRAEGDE